MMKRWVIVLLSAAVIVLSMDAYLRAERGVTGLAPNQPIRQESFQQWMKTSSDLNRALSILEDCFGVPVSLDAVRSVPVTITAYSSTVDQCDATPYVTATNRPVRIGILAVSDDLRTELGITFGTKVLIPGHGVFEVQDKMNPRWRRRVDIWHNDREAAMGFGKQEGLLIWAAKGAKEGELLAQHAKAY